MKIGILTDPTIGGTFVSWSVYYLSGAKDYWCWQTDKRLQLTHNPLSDINAHGFRPNQIKELDDLDCIVNNMPNAKNDLHVFYLHTHQGENLNQVINQLTIFIDKIITITVPVDHHFYHWKSESRDQLKSNAIQEHITEYFSDDLAKWQAMGLNEVWDQREFLALNLRPYMSYGQITDFTTAIGHNRFYLDARDAWFMLDQSMCDLMHFLKINIDKDRYQKWKQVYADWRTFHYNRVRFFWYFPEIMDAIIRGLEMDFSRFNLDLVQEAIIQHELIYQHNLNLKTFKLEKFLNAKQLHQLLEPNIHPIETY